MPIIETRSWLGVGNTPLLEFPKLAAEASPRLRLYAKAEWRNPGGSVKDRPAIAMIRAAEAEGRLRPGKTILDATSGNTGIAYAWIGARLGYRVRLCVPASINKERRGVLEAYGAELVMTSALEGTDGAQRAAKALFAEDPELYFYPDQYNNPENWRAHYETTAAEVWRQTEGALTHWVAGLGTSGTFGGTARRLRELKPSVWTVSVQPDSPLHGLEGLKHMASAIVPGIHDPGLADQQAYMDTGAAQAMVRRAAREEGVLIGPSGGANLAAALEVGRRAASAGEEPVVVTVLPDGGERYLGERFWEEGR